MIVLPVFGPRVALFFAHAPVCALRVSTFFSFENFENFNVLTVSAQTGALAHFRRQICIFELTVSPQTGALAHFRRQILHPRGGVTSSGHLNRPDSLIRSRKLHTRSRRDSRIRANRSPSPSPGSGFRPGAQGTSQRERFSFFGETLS